MQEEGRKESRPPLLLSACDSVLSVVVCWLPLPVRVPLQNNQGIVTHYVGIQTDMSAAAQAGLLDTPEQMTEQQAAGAAWGGRAGALRRAAGVCLRLSAACGRQD